MALSPADAKSLKQYERRMKQRDEFIQAVAEYVTNNSAHKSILLQMGNSEAQEWAKVRQSIPGLHGWNSVDEAVEALRNFLT